MTVTLSTVWGQTVSFPFPRLLFSSIPFSSVIFGPFAGTFSTARQKKSRCGAKADLCLLRCSISHLAKAGLPEMVPLTKSLFGPELAKAQLLGGPSLTLGSRRGSYIVVPVRLSSLSDHFLTIRLKPNLEGVCVCVFFQSNFLRPEHTDSF